LIANSFIQTESMGPRVRSTTALNTKNRSVLRLSTVLAAFTLISGCSTAHRLYVPPAGGEIAFLRVVDAEGRGLPGSIFISTFEKAENCQRRFFFQGVASQMRPTEITLSYAKIQAEKPFSLAINFPLGGSFSAGFTYCAPVVSFMPQAGRYYKASIAVDGNKACYLTVTSSTTETGAQLRIEPVKKLTFSNGMDEDSSFCKPQ